MQLKDKLGLAVCTLLSVGQTQAADTFYDFSVLSYSEKDNQNQDRVSVFEPVLSVTSQKADDDYIKYDLVYDNLTGSSPNGANASSNSQDFGSYSSDPGMTPLDSRFKDNRLALNISWMTPFDRESRYQGGISLSAETDYRSAGANYTYFQDINNKLTTLSFGGALSYDAINPKGGFNDPYTSIFATPSTSTTPVQTVTSSSGGGGEEDFNLFPGKTKTTFQGMVGISHVLNKYTLLNLNYGISSVQGYQTDPYKIISVINSNGLAVDYVWENRPDSRLKQTLKGSLVTAIGEDSLHLDYRYYRDDWGVVTHTYDLKYNLELGKKLTITPHYRLSKQSKADFYKLSLNQGEANPKYASADYRLSDMDTKTSGAMIAYKVNPQFSWTLNVEKITQTGDSYPAEAIGDQKLNDMFPDLEFWAITVGVRGKW
jgi:hypothetical protein